MTDESLPAEDHQESMYQRALSRRSLLAGAAAFGAVLAVPALACGGKSDKAAFDGGAQSPASTSASGGSATTAKAASGGPPIPANGKVVVDFTYAPSSGGIAKNPYIAVWVETASGTFVDTVSLWYQSGKGDKWLSDMRSWVSASGNKDRSMSSATRTAGSYSVVWDGNDAAGQRAAQGDYVIFLECAREKGPYSVISQPMTLGSAPVAANPAGKGDIATVSMTYSP